MAGEQRKFPRDARGLQADLRAIVRIMRVRYPNLKLVYLSSRTYGGYAITGLNPEPAAYDSAYAVRWLIQDRMSGKIKGKMIVVESLMDEIAFAWQADWNRTRVKAA